MKMLIKIGCIILLGGMLWLMITDVTEADEAKMVGASAPTSLLEAIKQAKDEQDPNLIKELDLLTMGKAYATDKLLAKDRDGNTPLLIAVYKDFVTATPRILAALRDYDIPLLYQRNARFNTALHFARTKKMMELLLPYMAKILQEASSDHSILQNKPAENTPLFFARTDEIAKLLEESQWPMHVNDVVNTSLQTPLMFVVGALNTDYVTVPDVELAQQSSANDPKLKEAEDLVRRDIAHNFILDAIKNSDKKVRISGDQVPFFEVRDIDGNTIFHTLAKSNLNPKIILDLILTIKRQYGEGSQTLNDLLAIKNNANQTAQDIAQASANRENLGEVINALALK